MSMVVAEKIPTPDFTVTDRCPNILIVNDDEAAVSELSDVLELEGLGCVVADTPARAVSLLDAFSSIKVIVTDFYLFGDSTGANNGLALIDEVRARFQNRRFEAVVISGDKDVLADCTLTGVEKFLAKPMAPESFCSVVRNALEAAQAPRHEPEDENSTLALHNMIEAQADAIATLTRALNETRSKCRNATVGLDRLVSAASIAHDRIHEGRDSGVDELLRYISGQGYSLKKLLHCHAKTAEQPNITTISTIAV